MQARMKKHPLSTEQIENLLRGEHVGRLATLGEDGFPYVIPVHFAHAGGCLYIHGLAAGEKLDNIRKNPNVGFEADTMRSLLHGEEPCNTNTEYESVVVRGRASIVDDPALKIAALDAIVAKYTPQHAGKAYPENMLKMTAVIAVSMDSCTGKYYPAQ